MSQGCFDRIIFFSPPHATNLFPLTSSSRIFRPRSSNLLGCHLWSYIYCCLSAVCSSSTFPLPCCFPHPCSSPCWPEPDFGVVTGLPPGPSLWSGDITVSGSLLSQTKCHSRGGLTFLAADAGAGILHAGCHPCGSNHKRTFGCIPVISFIHCYTC